MNSKAQTTAPAAPLPTPQAPTASTWRASLELRFEHGPRGTRLVRNRHRGPLCVQRPFYPEGIELPHVYLLHPPGGMVSGDFLGIDISLGENAAALFTTPGAGRVYRARRDQALQEQCNEFRVAANASLEWLPLETIVFPGANTRLRTRVALENDSRFCGWEITSLGLPSNKAVFSSGSLDQRLEVFVGGRPAFIEALRLDDGNRQQLFSTAGMGEFPVTGLFIAGPLGAHTLSADARDCLAALNTRQTDDCLLGISQTGDFLTARYLGRQAEQARAFFIEVWQQIRPGLLHRQVCTPRIWAT